MPERQSRGGVGGGRCGHGRVGLGRGEGKPGSWTGPPFAHLARGRDARKASAVRPEAKGMNHAT